MPVLDTFVMVLLCLNCKNDGQIMPTYTFVFLCDDKLLMLLSLATISAQCFAHKVNLTNMHPQMGRQEGAVLLA